MKYNQAVALSTAQMIEKALPLVGWTVRHYFKTRENVVGMSYDDLFQEGCVGLCRAAAEYDSSRGGFEPYAVKVVRNHLVDYCRSITGPTRTAPTMSLEQLTEDGWDNSDEEEGVVFSKGKHEDPLSALAARDFLEARKNRYAGTARLGMEALELKILGGYGVTDIAKRYDVKPNLVGAWISRARKSILSDITAEEMDAFGVEKAS